jgi:hypothetical protein
VGGEAGVSEERKSFLTRFWDRIFNSRSGSIREQRVLEYIVHRMNEGAGLHEVVEEEYVRRNATRDEIDTILSNPKVVEAARERMEQDFSSGDLDPNRRPG